MTLPVFKTGDWYRRCQWCVRLAHASAIVFKNLPVADRCIWYWCGCGFTANCAESVITIWPQQPYVAEPSTAVIPKFGNLCELRRLSSTCTSTADFAGSDFPEAAFMAPDTNAPAQFL